MVCVKGILAPGDSGTEGREAGSIAGSMAIIQIDGIMAAIHGNGNPQDLNPRETVSRYRGQPKMVKAPSATGGPGLKNNS